MATRINWSWDDNDGQLLKRFSRSLGYEVWLVGWETGDGDRHVNEGRSIVDTDTGARRDVTCICIPFAFSPRLLHGDGKLMVKAAGAGLVEPWSPVDAAGIIRACVPADGSFPSPAELAFLRSLSPDPDETFQILERRVAAPLPATSAASEGELL